MQLKIKTTTEEVITVETPKYYKTYYASQLVKLTESGMTKVGEDLIVHFSYSESMHFANDVNELIQKGTEITKEEFLELYKKALFNLNNIIHEL